MKWIGPQSIIWVESLWWTFYTPSVQPHTHVNRPALIIAHLSLNLFKQPLFLIVRPEIAILVDWVKISLTCVLQGVITPDTVLFDD